MIHIFTIKKRDEELKKKKELEAERKNKSKGEMEKNEQVGDWLLELKDKAGTSTINTNQ